MPVVHGYDIPPPPRRRAATPRQPPRPAPRRAGGWFRSDALRRAIRAVPQPGARLRTVILWGVLVLGILSGLSLLMEMGSAVLDEGPSILPSPGRHMVLPGESLSGIAARNGLSLDSLLSVGSNRSRFPNPDRILPGQEVMLP